MPEDATILLGRHVVEQFRQTPTLFACYGTLDRFGLPWSLGLFDAEQVGCPGCWDRFEVTLASPMLSLRELPALRSQWEDVGWKEGLCLSTTHYAGYGYYLSVYASGHTTFGCTVADNPCPSPLEIYVAPEVLREYLACLSLEPTTWRTRPGWVTNPAPFDSLTTGSDFQLIADIDTVIQRRARWFQSIAPALGRACYGAFH